MSLQGVISKWKTGTYAVSRSNITMVDGLAVEGTPTTFNIDASVQPAPEAKLVDNPEGQTFYDRLLVWSLSELRLRTSTTAPDIITIGGIHYRTVDANHYGIISNHWQMTVERLDVP